MFPYSWHHSAKQKRIVLSKMWHVTPFYWNRSSFNSKWSKSNLVSIACFVYRNVVLIGKVIHKCEDSKIKVSTFLRILRNYKKSIVQKILKGESLQQNSPKSWNSVSVIYWCILMVNVPRRLHGIVGLPLYRPFNKNQFYTTEYKFRNSKKLKKLAGSWMFKKYCL